MDRTTRAAELAAIALDGTPEEQTTFLVRECVGDPELSANVWQIMDEKKGEESATGLFGRYEIISPLGQGGYGVVYRARQADGIHREFALKVVKLGLNTAEVARRFEEERQTLARMNHGNIPNIFDSGSTPGGRPYFVMELIEGPSISDYCDAKRLDLRKRLELFIKVCEAIEHAHQKSIIHRDIKPSNILMVENTGEPKVIDFGIAKVLQKGNEGGVNQPPGQMLGTPAYMSPEQADSKLGPVDTRSDIYSLGVLLYFLLVKETPFENRELLKMPYEAMRKTITDTVPSKPSERFKAKSLKEQEKVAADRGLKRTKLLELLREDLDFIVMKCLEKNPSERYATVSLLVADLRRFFGFEPVAARPKNRVYKATRALRRNRIAYAAGFCVFIALITGFALALLGFLDAKKSYNNLKAVQQQSARDRVRFAIISGDSSRTTSELKEAEKFGLPEYELALLRGQFMVDSGQSIAAVTNLGLLLSNHWSVATLGLYVQAQSASGNGDVYEKMTGDLEMAESKAQSFEDFLYLGEAFANWNAKKGVKLIEKALKIQEASPTARLALARARTLLAAETDDGEMMGEALKDVEAAGKFSSGGFVVLLNSSYAHRYAAGIFDRTGDRVKMSNELEFADIAGRELERFDQYPIALYERLYQLIQCGSLDQVLEKSQKWGKNYKDDDGFTFIQAYAQIRLGHKVDAYRLLEAEFHGHIKPEDLESSDRMSLAFLMFVAALEMDDFSQKCPALLVKMTQCNSKLFVNFLSVQAAHLLLGKTNESLTESSKWYSGSTNKLNVLNPHDTNIVKYLMGQILSDDFLSRCDKSNNDKCDAFCFIGLTCLAHGDRKGALENLRRADQRGSDQFWSWWIANLVYHQLSANPRWPQSIP